MNIERSDAGIKKITRAARANGARFAELVSAYRGLD
jgi:hypothetical protein